MADYFLVKNVSGPSWDPARGRRQQDGWDEHALFMDALTEEGFVVLGGPVGPDDGDYTMLVVDAENEAAVRDRLAADPWADTVLKIETVEPWSVWLRAPD